MQTMSTTIALEIAFIALLLFANGVFAMSEIAIVTARKTRLQHRANQGKRGAATALELANTPDRFLSTVQIGITLIGILAGAFGGATIAEQLAAQIGRVPALAPYSEAISLAIVVLVITYLSLIVGELVPKRIALNNPERIASFVSRPMLWLSKLSAPAVWLLSVSTSFLVKLLQTKQGEEPPITEEEIRVLIEQGTNAGVFAASEQDIVEGALQLDSLRIPQLMTTRLEVNWINIEDAPEKIRWQIINNPYSRLPVCQGQLDNVLGVVKAKDLLIQALKGEPMDLNAAMRPPLFIPESRTALHLLELFKRSHTHLAIVVDEHGAVEGLVTMNDLLEAIVGELPQSGIQAEPYAVKREDGSWLLDGRLTPNEFYEIFPSAGKLPSAEEGAYHTLAGFIMMKLGRLPQVADHFEWNGLRFEVVDMDRRRIDKVLVSSLKAEPNDK
jgi:putative hemolysin